MDNDWLNWDLFTGFPQEQGNVAPEGDDALLTADFGLGDASGFEAGESSLSVRRPPRLSLPQQDSTDEALQPQFWQLYAFDPSLEQRPTNPASWLMPQQYATQSLSLELDPFLPINTLSPRHASNPQPDFYSDTFKAGPSFVGLEPPQYTLSESGNVDTLESVSSGLFNLGGDDGDDMSLAPSITTHQRSEKRDGQQSRHSGMEIVNNLEIVEPKLIEDSCLHDSYVASKGGFVCKFSQCKSKVIFKRRFELQRHMLIHVPKKPFDCPVDSCHRRGRYTFYRDDKRKAHLKSRHTDDDYATCPVPGCPAGPLQLDLLRVHLPFHSYLSNLDTIKSLKTYAEEGQKCPMHKCRRKRWLSSDQLAGKKGHLVSHNEADRISQASTLRENGFGIQGELVCPMCGTPSSDTAEFCKHMTNEHILTDHGKGHLEAVRSAGLDLFRESVLDRPAWEVGQNNIELWWDKSYSCPCCSFRLQGRFYGQETAHPGLLRPSEELYPYRRQILRLWPSFGSHPVFDDLRRKARPDLFSANN